MTGALTKERAQVQGWNFTTVTMPFIFRGFMPSLIRLTPVDRETSDVGYEIKCTNSSPDRTMAMIVNHLNEGGHPSQLGGPCHLPPQKISQAGPLALQRKLLRTKARLKLLAFLYLVALLFVFVPGGHTLEQQLDFLYRVSLFFAIFAIPTAISFRRSSRALTARNNDERTV